MHESEDQTAIPAIEDRTTASLAGEAADMAQSTLVTGAVAGLLILVSIPVVLVLGAREIAGRLLKRSRP